MFLGSVFLGKWFDHIPGDWQYKIIFSYAHLSRPEVSLLFYLTSFLTELPT